MGSRRCGRCSGERNTRREFDLHGQSEAYWCTNNRDAAGWCWKRPDHEIYKSCSIVHIMSYQTVYKDLSFMPSLLSLTLPA